MLFALCLLMVAGSQATTIAAPPSPSATSQYVATTLSSAGNWTLNSTHSMPRPSDREYMQRMQRLQQEQQQHLCNRCDCYGLRSNGAGEREKVRLDENLNEIKTGTSSSSPRAPPERPRQPAAPVTAAPPDIQVLVLNCTARLPAQKVSGWAWPARLSAGEVVASETWVEFQGGNLSGVVRLPLLPFRLTNLSLADNVLHAIAPRAFANLAQLRHLDLRHNHLKDVPHDAFFDLSSLEWLDLSFNALGSDRLPALPPDLFQGLNRLQVVNLRHNSLSGDLTRNPLPSSNSLRFLDLSHNTISSIGDIAWRGFPNLKELDLSWNSLRELSNAAFQKLPALERLDLSHNPQLSVVAAGTLAGLSTLRVLDLSSCPLGDPSLLEGGTEKALQLPADVQELRLSQCGLDEFLVRDWGGLRDLRSLDVSGNKISVLTDIAHLNKLRELNVSHNGLARLSTVTLPHLQVLDVSHNQLECAPALSADLTPQLQQLILDGNPLEELNLRVPPSLEFLSIQRMPRLHRLPQQAIFLAAGETGDTNRTGNKGTDSTHCLRLIIRDNPLLTQVHTNAFEKVLICQLDLSRNALAWLPEAVAAWESIDVIDLQGNPWMCTCKLQWMLDSLVKQVYATQPALLEELRCAAPESLQHRRLVHWFNHTGSVLCDGESNDDLQDIKGAGVTFVLSNTALILIICLSVGLLCLVLLGILAQRKYVGRRRTKNRRM